MKYQFIEDHSHSYGVALLCAARLVSRSAYYHWRKRKPSLRDIWCLDLVATITKVFEDLKGRYGTPHIYKELKKLEYKVSLNTVAKIMSKHNLVGMKRKRFKRTINSDHDLKIYPNLLQQNFKAAQKNEL
jgi:putative transposase